MVNAGFFFVSFLRSSINVGTDIELAVLFLDASSAARLDAGRRAAGREAGIALVPGLGGRTLDFKGSGTGAGAGACGCSRRARAPMHVVCYCLVRSILVCANHKDWAGSGVDTAPRAVARQNRAR